MTDEEFINGNSRLAESQSTYVLLYSDVSDVYRIERAEEYNKLGSGVRNWMPVAFGSQGDMEKAERSATR